MAGSDDATLSLPDPLATEAVARWLAPWLGAGDVVLLSGPIGAGKTHLARALIQHRQAAHGAVEDVPSPSYTLVQEYRAGDLEIWHVDLYRLADPGEAAELGLDAAFETALCLIEWPERFEGAVPPGALTLALAPDGAGRVLTLRADAPRWAPLISAAREGVDA